MNDQERIKKYTELIQESIIKINYEIKWLNYWLRAKDILESPPIASTFNFSIVKGKIKVEKDKTITPPQWTS